MRESRQSGSEGRAGSNIPVPTPIPATGFSVTVRLSVRSPLSLAFPPFHFYSHPRRTEYRPSGVRYFLNAFSAFTPWPSDFIFFSQLPVFSELFEKFSSRTLLR
jgi:hypothetical protein